MAETDTSTTVSPLVFTDELTGLHNQRHIHQYLLHDVDWQASGPEPLSLIMIDLDSFAAVNEKLGRAEANKLLIQAADVLGESFRNKDILGRYAGDGFCVILPRTGRDKAVNLAEQARQRLEERLKLTASAGVAVFPEDAQEAEVLLYKVDRALQHAKANGRNMVSDALSMKRRKEPVPEEPSGKLYIGSEEKIEKIVRLLDDAREGRSGFVFVKTLPATGKIRFLGELVRRMKAAGAGCIVETFTEQDRDAPYKLLTELIDRFLRREVAQLRRIKDNLSFDEIVLLAKEIPTLAAVVEDVGGDAGAVEGKSAPQKKCALFDGLTHTMSAISQERALFIILDEFHYVDDGTLNVILSLLNRSSARIVLCGALQLGQPGKTLATEGKGLMKFMNDIRSAERAVEMMLTPFKMQEVAGFVSHLLPGREESGDFDRLMLEASRGNPLYIESAVQLLKSQKVIRFEGGTWKLGHVQRGDLPNTLDELVQSKMATLDEECEKIISKAAVIGSNFSLEVLGQVADTNEGEMLEVLDKARKLGIIERPEVLNNDRMNFASRDVHDTVYVRTDDYFRTTTHVRVAEVLEDIYRENPGRAAFTLAYHYQKAGKEEKAQSFRSLGEERADRVYDGAQIDAHARGEGAPGGKGVEARIPECDGELSDEEIDLIMQALQALSRTSKSLQMYPEGSQMVLQAVDQLRQAVQQGLEGVEGFTVGESGEGMLLNGRPVDAKIGGMTATEILKAMRERFIQSLTVVRGVASEELLAFTRLFGKPPVRGTLDRGFWNNCLEEAGVEHIDAVQKAYVMDTEIARQSGVSGSDLPEGLSGEAMQAACIVVRHMHGTVEKMAMYPPGSSIIAGAVKELEESARTFFAARGGLSVSEVDGTLLIDGVPPGAEALAGGAADLAGVLRKSGVKSCIFSGDSAIDEMSGFLQLVAGASDPRPVDEWKALLAGKNISHIQVGDTIYHGAAAGGGDGGAGTEPEPEPEPEPVATDVVERAEQIAGYPPDKLLAAEAVAEVPGILKTLLRGRKSALLQELIGAFTSILSSGAAELHGKATKALLNIYQKSVIEVQEVLLTLSRDAVIDALASEKSPQACANLLHFAGQVARRCVEQGDFDSLDRTVTAMGERAMEEGEGSEIQKAAEEALASLFGSTAFRTLLIKVKSPSFGASRQVIDILAAFENLAVPILVSLIEEAEAENTRRFAAKAIREIGPDAVKALTGELTRYASPGFACRILGVLGEVEADVGQAVSQTIMHPDEKVRAGSVQALKGMERRAAVDVLAGVAGGKDPEGVRFAVAALGALGYAESVDWLAGLLEEPGDPVTQTAACAALGMIADPKAVPVLKKVAESKRMLGLSTVFPNEVRAAAAAALAAIGGDKAATVLERLARDKRTAIRKAADKKDEPNEDQLE